MLSDEERESLRQLTDGVSSTLKEYTEGDPGIRFEEHGEYHFKGLHGEHMLYVVQWR